LPCLLSCADGLAVPCLNAALLVVPAAAAVVFLNPGETLLLLLCLFNPGDTFQALGGTSFCSDDDSLVLEDEGARMTLRSECPGLNPDAVVTGGHLTRQRGVIQQLPRRVMQLLLNMQDVLSDSVQ